MNNVPIRQLDRFREGLLVPRGFPVPDKCFDHQGMVEGGIGNKTVDGTCERRTIVLEIRVINPRHLYDALLIDQTLGRPFEPLRMVIE